MKAIIPLSRAYQKSQSLNPFIFDVGKDGKRFAIVPISMHIQMVFANWKMPIFHNRQYILLIYTMQMSLIEITHSVLGAYQRARHLFGSNAHICLGRITLQHMHSTRGENACDYRRTIDDTWKVFVHIQFPYTRSTHTLKTHRGTHTHYTSCRYVFFRVCINSESEKSVQKEGKKLISALLAIKFSKFNLCVHSLSIPKSVC